MPRLVYWYGTPHWKNLTRAFSLIQYSDIISHDEGVKMGLNKFPNPQKKVGTEMKLTEHDEFLINGLEELETELALPKEERVAWLRKKGAFEKLPPKYPVANKQIPFQQDSEISSKFFKKEADACTSSLPPMPSIQNYPAHQQQVPTVICNTNDMSVEGKDTAIFSDIIYSNTNHRNENHPLFQYQCVYQQQAAEAMHHISSMATWGAVEDKGIAKIISTTTNNVDSNSNIENQRLLSFLQSQNACIKGSPMTFFNWLVNSEDIASLADLAEAFTDKDYVHKSLQVGDGQASIKGFKRGVFKKAIDHELGSGSKKEN